MTDRAAAGELVLANARLVLGGEVVRGSVRVAAGRIASADPGGTAVPGAVDCEGDLLAPGLIELHTDNLERHVQPRPGVRWPLPAAVVAHDAELASAGIATVFDALRVGDVVTHSRGGHGGRARELADAISALKAAGALRLSHFVHLRAEICSETLAGEIAAFGPEDDVRIVSLMDHTPGQRQFRDLTMLRRYHESGHRRSALDFQSYIDFLCEVKAQFGESHEDVAVARAKALGATLASHDDTEPEHVARSAAHGCRLAEFPTTLEAARACRAHGIAVMMGAPNLLRGGSHTGNAAAAEMAAEGVLDILSSDYAPSSLLMGALRLGRESGDLAAGFATVTRNPARAAGLDDRGEIAPGLRADLIRVSDAFETPVVRGLWIAGARAG